MQSDTKSFIVRIWLESTTNPEQTPTWRGVVEQVGNSKRLYFQDLERAFQFVREQTGIEEKITTISNPQPWWKTITQHIRNASYLSRHKQTEPPPKEPR